MFEREPMMSNIIRTIYYDNMDIIEGNFTKRFKPYYKKYMKKITFNYPYSLRNFTNKNSSLFEKEIKIACKIKCSNLCKIIMDAINDCTKRANYTADDLDRVIKVNKYTLNEQIDRLNVLSTKNDKLLYNKPSLEDKIAKNKSRINDVEKANKSVKNGPSK